jgi:short-subunit dehydrogenase
MHGATACGVQVRGKHIPMRTQAGNHAPEKELVLLTGATSGIGHELGVLFAQAGHPMLIVGRDPATLETTAASFRDMGSPRVHQVVADLSLPEGPLKVRQAAHELDEFVGILVNDAGRGIHGPFEDTDLETELGIVQLNISALVQLTKYFGADMVRRKHGRILQLASIASYQPTPLLTVYAATKAFVLSFTDALRDEWKKKGVTVTAVIPGATDTDFFRKAEMEHTVAASDPQDPAVIARIAFDALFKGAPHAVAPGMTAQIVMSSLMSNERVAAMAHKQMLPAEEE